MMTYFFRTLLAHFKAQLAYFSPFIWGSCAIFVVLGLWLFWGDPRLKLAGLLTVSISTPWVTSYLAKKACTCFALARQKTVVVAKQVEKKVEEKQKVAKEKAIVGAQKFKKRAKETFEETKIKTKKKLGLKLTAKEKKSIAKKKIVAFWSTLKRPLVFSLGACFGYFLTKRYIAWLSVLLAISKETLCYLSAFCMGLLALYRTKLVLGASTFFLCSQIFAFASRQPNPIPRSQQQAHELFSFSGQEVFFQIPEAFLAVPDAEGVPEIPFSGIEHNDRVSDHFSLRVLGGDYNVPEAELKRFKIGYNLIEFNIFEGRATQSMLDRWMELGGRCLLPGENPVLGFDRLPRLLPSGVMDIPNQHVDNARLERMRQAHEERREQQRQQSEERRAADRLRRIERDRERQQRIEQIRQHHQDVQARNSAAEEESAERSRENAARHAAADARRERQRQQRQQRIAQQEARRERILQQGQERRAEEARRQEEEEHQRIEAERLEREQSEEEARRQEEEEHQRIEAERLEREQSEEEARRQQEEEPQQSEAEIDPEGGDLRPQPNGSILQGVGQDGGQGDQAGENGNGNGMLPGDDVWVRDSNGGLVIAPPSPPFGGENEGSSLAGLASNAFKAAEHVTRETVEEQIKNSNKYQILQKIIQSGKETIQNGGEAAKKIHIVVAAPNSLEQNAQKFVPKGVWNSFVELKSSGYHLLKKMGYEFAPTADDNIRQGISQKMVKGAQTKVQECTVQSQEMLAGATKQFLKQNSKALIKNACSKFAGGMVVQYVFSAGGTAIGVMRGKNEAMKSAAERSENRLHGKQGLDYFLAGVENVFDKTETFTSEAYKEAPSLKESTVNTVAGMTGGAGGMVLGTSIGLALGGGLLSWVTAPIGGFVGQVVAKKGIDISLKGLFGS